MDRILVTPSEFRHTAAKCRGYSQEQQTLVTNCSNEINNLLANWDGQASLAFRDRFEELRRPLESVVELLADIGDACDRISDNYENTDRAMADNLRSQG